MRRPAEKTGSTAKASGTCTPVRVLWQRGMVADIWLLAGSIVVGVVGGVLGGLWCAGRPRTLPARALQTGAALAYCAPPYFVGLALLYLFNPVYGILHIPGFFDAEPHWASPFTDPWTWLRTLLVPWLGPGRAAGRHVPAADAGHGPRDHPGGLRPDRGGEGRHEQQGHRRHVGPATFAATVSFAPVTLPLFLANVMLVELVFSVPGFFHYLWEAIGHNNESAINLPIIIAAALWTTVLTIVLGMLADGILGRLDPRVRGAAF